MSKQRLQELENQYYMLESQDGKLVTENSILLSEIAKIELQLNQLSSAQQLTATQLKNQTKACSQNLDKIWNENKMLTNEIEKQENMFNKITALLTEYTEYAPVMEHQPSGPMLNTQIAGELAGTLSNVNISDL